ncbi:MAG: class I SAM-dependent methyltransferase [Candidatus Brocadiaceae bacterium]|nr:class I SAM-dependent methyltransferase [Candidatus Brocadiaceae bacterium]
MNKKELAAYYSKHHKEGKRLNFVFGGNERVEIFKSWIGSGKTILDLGCRDGSLTKYFIEGNLVIGVDVDQEALNICKNEVGIKTVWLDLNNENLPFEDESFDVVIAGEILEHIFYPDLFLKKIKRVLKKKGIFMGSVPNAFRLKNRLKFLLGIDFEDDKTHLRRFSLIGLKKLLEQYFVGVEIIPISSHFLFLSPHLFGNDLLWKCQK